MKKLFALIGLTFLLAGCLGGAAPTSTPEPTQVSTVTPAATATPAPTATPTLAPTATPTPSPTPAATPTASPEYAGMSAQKFIASCNQKAVVPGALRASQPVAEGGLLYNKYVIHDGSSYIPLEGFPPQQKPATMDATGSTNYKFYGTPIANPNSDHKCWMQVEKIE